MSPVFDEPLIVFALALVGQWLAAYGADLLRRRVRQLGEDERADFGTVQTASLTLLALIIGFTFSMAVTRYDQRKNYEEAEANAIGTEYVRADLLPAEAAASVRALLRDYLALRVLFYETADQHRVAEVGAATAKVQAALWSAVARVAQAQPTVMVAQAVSGMNDVLNAQGYTQAAWWNRIPVAAWMMLGLIAVSCNGLIGYGERRGGALMLFVLPAVISIACLLIADIDSPRGGIIRVYPQNLLALSQSMKAP